MECFAAEGACDDPAHVVQGIPSACDVRGQWDVRMHDLHAEVADSMGLMRSRAELSDEPRVMPFVVEGGCPFDSREKAQEGSLPVVIFVRLDKTPRPAMHETCPLRKYYVDQAEADRSRALVGLPPKGMNMAVCEHMGHLIE